MLDCNHAFCQLCLESLVEAGTICCPRCNKHTSVGAEGLNSLRSNFELGGLSNRLSELQVAELNRRTSDLLLDDIGASCPVCMV